MIRLLTAPLWLLPWAVAKMFRARAIVRSGRRTVPVKVATMVASPPVRPNTVRLIVTIRTVDR